MNFSYYNIFSNWNIYMRLFFAFLSSKIRSCYKYISKDEATSYVSLDGKSITLHYKKNDTPYQITLPYNFFNSLSMHPLSATLHYYGSSGIISANDVDITQQPGIPYLASAKDYGADSIHITNKETGAVKIYKNEEKPYYVKELYTDE